MTNLGWKFYIVNASYNIIFLLAVYLFWVETARLPLEDVAKRFGDLPDVGLLEGVPSSIDDGEARDKISKELE